jgi:hypothetical protein
MYQTAAKQNRAPTHSTLNRRRSLLLSSLSEALLLGDLDALEGDATGDKMIPENVIAS